MGNTVKEIYIYIYIYINLIKLNYISIKNKVKQFLK